MRDGNLFMGEARGWRGWATLVLAACLPLVAAPMAAAAPPPADDLRARYERAAAWQDHEARQYVLNAEVAPTWIAGTDSFWYRRQTPQGDRYVVFDAVRGTRAEAFDHERLAARLAAVGGLPVAAGKLPLSGLSLTLKPRAARFSAFGKPWRYDIGRQVLTEDTGPTRDPGALLVSPDGTRGLFVRDHNLWVRDLGSGAERALTTDGAPSYAYAVLPALLGQPTPRPEAIWSPDSTHVFTAQVDERQLREIPSIEFAPANGSVVPKVSMTRGALPGDAHVTTFRLVVIDAGTGAQVAAHYPPIPVVRMYDTPFGGGRAWWSADAATAYFVEVERGERTARVVAMDATTGGTRTVLEERAERYLELGSKVVSRTALVPLPATNELVWYSERSGWAHLYLYDLGTGALKRQLTTGEWRVREVVAVDAARRELWFTASGRVPGRNPYYRELARVGLDDAALTIVSSSDADHRVRNSRDAGAFAPGGDSELESGLAPGAAYIVETVTRADGPSRTRLVRRDGTEAALVDAADASRLPPGWSWPEPVVLKAADGTTDIGALVFRPSDFSPAHRYPVIDCVYGGPQVSHLPSSYGGTLCYFDAASMAELGFVVVIIAGRGTADRSRAFHEASYGAVHTASNLEDHVAVIRQLAARHPYLDLERVGITGFSGGGYMAAIGMLRFPDFYKVGVAASGNYDQRLFWHTWGERYQGLVDGDNYLPQAASTYASALKGKLMLMHGLADPGVHPAALFQLTQALIDAGKDFDLTLQPRAGHEIGGWAQRRQWDYFVRHLAGLEPPPPVIHRSQSDIENGATASAGGAPAPVIVTLDTSAGEIDIAVDLQRAPLTAADFLRYVDAKRYDGAEFFRTVRADNDRGNAPIEIVQAALPEGREGLPPIAHETTRATGITHVDGTVSVARAAPGTGTAAAFFISVGDQPALDHGGLRNPDGLGFAAFGRVVRGMDVVRKIHGMPVASAAGEGYMAGQVLVTPVVIRRAYRQPGGAGAAAR